MSAPIVAGWTFCAAAASARAFSGRARKRASRSAPCFCFAAAKLTSTSPPANEAWSSLARAVFHATRRMSGPARTATGARLEDAALAAAREAAGGHADAARQWLGQLALLVEIAADLGDLPAAERTAVEGALEATRRALAPAR